MQEAYSAEADVTGNPDLWGRVLSLLSLRDMCIASATCTQHRALLPVAAAGRDTAIFNLKWSPEEEFETGGRYFPEIRHRGPTTTRPSSHRSTSPDPAGTISFCLQEGVSGQSCKTKHVGTTVGSDPLYNVTARMPSLTRLIIDLTLKDPTYHSIPASAYSSQNGVPIFLLRRRVKALLPPLDGEEERLLAHRNTVQHLSLVCEDANDEFDDANTCEDYWPPTSGNRAFHEHLQVPPRDLFRALVLSNFTSLVSLDVRGLGKMLTPPLLRAADRLSSLRLLRIGAYSMESQELPCPQGTVARLGEAFPSLTGLDVGYLEISQGVIDREVEALARSCSDLRHLDLSQVMRYMDFGPCLEILSRDARNLRSLAVHGLVVEDHGLLQLARSCPLEALHLVACQGYSAPGLAAFLRAAPNLTNLNLSRGYAPETILLAWLKVRHASGSLPDVTWLAIAESYDQESDVEAALSQEEDIPAFEDVGGPHLTVVRTTFRHDLRVALSGHQPHGRPFSFWRLFDRESLCGRFHNGVAEEFVRAANRAADGVAVPPGEMEGMEELRDRLLRFDLPSTLVL